VNLFAAPGPAPKGRARARSLRRRARPAMWVSLLLSAVTLVAILAPGAALASPPRASSAVRALDAPVLTLVPSPSEGNAPMEVNVTAMVSGGVGPYDLSLCFGTVDHTSPTLPCGVGDSNWSGAAPLVFSHAYLTPGNFSVTGVVTDARGAGVGSTALIVVTSGVALAATAFELTGSGTAPLVARFNESVVGGTPPITLQWTFGDGASGSELPGVPIEHTYTAPGTYVPTLTVTDGAGHSTVRALPTITVSPRPGLGPLPGGLALGAIAELAAAFASVAVAVAVAVTLVLRRQWRREGDELVRRARSDARPRQEPPSTP
jgi:PKD repeat protein